MRINMLIGQKRKLATLISVILVTSTTLIFLHQVADAETAIAIKPSQAPLDLEKLKKPKGVITADTIDLANLTVPSLWWAKETSENKLLDNWIAYPANQGEPARVDLIVNQQIWTLLDYLERYEFVNRVGSDTRNYGYNLRVFNYQQEFLGSYTCNFAANKSACDINMNTQNQLGMPRSS
ncbi:hypothetical protein [Brunnivagina elsteri]|uniref:Uncharacterized protein n=1 Tax=Brunnivagina elsteri CCALA 953 TaxID=987040 RepID=A0A2A2TGQ4_9CYAN|nr:hypothetical protein [Calothrix elsteri]PAX52815.1 hypothetical protein CK510_17295 [Calothrix elsteri CCALA 953]